MGCRKGNDRMNKKTSIYKDKPLTDVKWDGTKLIKLSHYEPKRYHKNDFVNDFIRALKQAADKEPQGFSKEQKRKTIEKILERLEE